LKTLEEHMNDFLLYMETARYSKQTVYGYQKRLKPFIKWLEETYGITTLEKLSARHLEAWQQYMGSKNNSKGVPYKATALNRHYHAVRGLLRNLEARGLLSKKLADVIQLAREPRRLPGTTLNDEDMHKLFNAVQLNAPNGYCIRAMFELMYSTGLRVGELVSLDTGNIDFEEDTLTVIGKGNKERRVPIGKTAMRYLESYVKAVRLCIAAQGDQALFINEHSGRRFKAGRFQEIVRKIGEQAGIDERVTPHVFRRSCTTEMIKSGANMYHVKEILGHESLDTLKHYTKLTILDLKATHAACHPREKGEGTPGADLAL